MLNRLFKRYDGGSSRRIIYEDSKRAPGLGQAPSIEFRYQPLTHPEREIRLLKLLPGVYSSKIEFQIHTTTFPPSNEYIALSYEWGRPEDVKTILVNGHEMKIRINLWRFLQRLRSHCFDAMTHDLESGYLWCDAICIDQNPLSMEKTHQIRLMAQIYAGAQTVYAWLGEHDIETQTMCQRLTLYVQQHGMPTGANKIELEAIKHCLGSSIVAIERLLNRSYWQRLWIVQEILMPKLIAIFCGGHYFDPASVDLLWILARMHRDLFHIGVDQPDDNLGLGYSLLSERGFSDQAKSHITSLRDLVCANSQRACSDPRDYVYALLGMARESKIGQIFPVDYKTTLETLLEELILFYDDNIPLDALKALIHAFSGHVHAEGLWHIDSTLSQLCNSPRLSGHRYSMTIENLGEISGSMKLNPYNHEKSDSDIVWRHLCGSEARNSDSVFRFRHRSLCLICRHNWGAPLSLVGLGSVEVGYRASARWEAYSEATHRGTFQLAKAIVSSTTTTTKILSLRKLSDHFKFTCSDAMVIESAERLGPGFTTTRLNKVSELRYLKSGTWQSLYIRSPSELEVHGAAVR